VQIKQKLAGNNLLVGALCWMMAAEVYYNDGYTLYASSPDLKPLSDMARAINKPAPAKK
jgi:hypothetical protein